MILSPRQRDQDEAIKRATSALQILESFHIDRDLLLADGPVPAIHAIFYRGRGYALLTVAGSPDDLSEPWERPAVRWCSRAGSRDDHTAKLDPVTSAAVIDLTFRLGGTASASRRVRDWLHDFGIYRTAKSLVRRTPPESLAETVLKLHERRSKTGLQTPRYYQALSALYLTDALEAAFVETGETGDMLKPPSRIVHLREVSLKRSAAPAARTVGFRTSLSAMA